jgi:rhodanese-related sulfurtransferase
MRMCGCDQLERVIHMQGAQVVDVREAIEYRSEHIHGTLHVPLSELNEDNLSPLRKDKPVYVVCKSGFRSQKAAEQMIHRGFNQVYVLEGGLDAWRQAGKALNRGTERHVWSMDRQVRFLAGTLMILGIALSHWVHPFWIGVSVLVGAGFIFSAITDTCGMGMMLAKMPWNRVKR